MTPQGRKDVGAWLRAARERRGLSIEGIAAITRIPREALRCLEDERWADLPADSYVRGFLRAYARVLGVPEAEILAAHARARADAPPEAPRPPPQATFRVRRAGLAVAVLILIVLLTLILVMVLRPRREAPAILSMAQPAAEGLRGPSQS